MIAPLANEYLHIPCSNIRLYQFGTAKLTKRRSATNKQTQRKPNQQVLGVHKRLLKEHVLI